MCFRKMWSWTILQSSSSSTKRTFDFSGTKFFSSTLTIFHFRFNTKRPGVINGILGYYVFVRHIGMSYRQGNRMVFQNSWQNSWEITKIRGKSIFWVIFSIFNVKNSWNFEKIRGKCLKNLKIRGNATNSWRFGNPI